MTKADKAFIDKLGKAIGSNFLRSEKEMALALALRDQRSLLVDIYDNLKTYGNCPFCHGDKEWVTPGARMTNKRVHGHPKNCLWLRLKREIHDEDDQA